MSPAGETRAADSNGLAESCIDTFKKIYPVNKAKLGLPVITRSAEWGLIFRADFHLNGQPASEFVNRLICWKKDNGVIHTTIAIGQQVVPLSEEK